MADTAKRDPTDIVLDEAEPVTVFFAPKNSHSELWQAEISAKNVIINNGDKTGTAWVYLLSYISNAPSHVLSGIWKSLVQSSLQQNFVESF